VLDRNAVFKLRSNESQTMSTSVNLYRRMHQNNYPGIRRTAASSTKSMKTSITNKCRKWVAAAAVSTSLLGSTGNVLAQTAMSLYDFTTTTDGGDPLIGVVSGTTVFGSCISNGLTSLYGWGWGTVWAVPTTGFTGTPP